MAKSGTPWTDTENDTAVASYFFMLSKELSGKPYNKTEQRLRLDKQLKRGDGSIELKHQNISAVLLGLGEPWIAGYKPARNFQLSLVDAVIRWLQSHPDWSPLSLAHSQQIETSLAVAERKMLWIGPPPTHSNAPPLVDPGALEAVYRKIDVAARDAANRALGRAGEERLFHHERQSLELAGLSHLAEQVRWISNEGDDAAGFDILSFEPDGRERLIEVKTTNGWERTPFHISRNELATAEQRREHWHLVRLYDFCRSPRAFSLRPPLDRHVELMPTSFMATLR